MDTVSKAINMIMDKFHEEYGQDVNLEDGDEISAVFNDGVILVSVDDGNVSIKVSCGTPYKFDFDLDLLEGEE